MSVNILRNGELVPIAGNGTSGQDAAHVAYDNSTSGLSANNVQTAIDAVDSKVDTLESATYVNSFNTRTGAVTLSSTDVTTALGYTPPQQDTTYSDATQSVHGLMSTADKTKLDGIADNANNYSLPLAASGTRGGIQIGYSESGDNYAVKLSSEKAYVTVAKTTSQVTRTTTTYVQGTTAEAALLNLGVVYVYNVTSASWTTNSESGTSTDYPYKYTISQASRYTANSSPMWMMISNSGASAVPSATELAEGAKVAVAMFTTSGITLYATAQPSVDLKLLAKGV